MEILNFKRDKKALLAENTTIKNFIASKEVEMDGKGRVLVRTSGTEPIIRVMVEGQDEAMVSKTVREIAAVVEKELG